MIIFPAFSFFYIFLCASIKESALEKSVDKTVSIIGFTFLVSNSGKICYEKFFIRFDLYSSDRAFNKLVFNTILF